MLKSELYKQLNFIPLMSYVVIFLKRSLYYFSFVNKYVQLYGFMFSWVLYS